MTHADTPIFSDFANEAMYAPLLAEFVGEVPALVAEIEQAIAREQADEARRLAHRLKGAASTYGFPTLASVCGVIEATVRNATSEGRRPDHAVLAAQASALTAVGARVAAGVPQA